MENKISCVFLGGLPSEKTSEIIRTNCITMPQFAAETFQKNFLEVLNKVVFKKIYFVSLPYVGVFGIHTKLKFLKQQDSDCSYKISPSFNTLPFFTSISKTKKITSAISSIIEVNESEHFVVFCYSLHEPFLNACSNIKKQYGERVKIIVIVPDLPKFTSNYKGFKGVVSYFFKKYQLQSVRKNIPHIHSYIFFVERMKSFFNDNKPYIVLNGLVPQNGNLESFQKVNFTKVLDYNIHGDYLLYTGVTCEEYGVKDLVDSFCLLSAKHQNLSLVLCGKGDLDFYIMSKVSQGFNIKHLGVIEHSKIQMLQKNAKLLINPRTPLGEFTSYSFPSKMFEYIYALRPIVGYSLPPYNEDFSALLIQPKTPDVNGLHDAILYGLNMTEYSVSSLIERMSRYIENELSTDVLLNRLNTLIKY